MPPPARATTGRLVAAAAACFAERGFHGTTIREIAERARVNVAAAHYHYGSKRDLYLAVLREQFGAVRRVLDARGARPTPARGRVGRAQVERQLRARIRAMFEVLLAPPGLHGTLMLREMADPSEALPVIVDEFIVPLVREAEELVRRLAPRLDPETLERCVASIVGQVYFYRFTMPATLHMKGWKTYPPQFVDRLVDHVTTFVLGGMARVVAGCRPRRTHAR